jgi:translation initiation factor IF-2
VAINKMDKVDARPDVVMRDLASEGVQSEEWGGEVQFCRVSAATGEGIEELLDSVLLQAEVRELVANPNVPAKGVVLEAYLDKGRGPVANVLVQDGTLVTGSVVVAGSSYGKIRAITDDRGKQIAKAGPSTPVEVLGLSEVPNTGDAFHVVTDPRVAQQLAERRKKAKGKGTTIVGTKTGIDTMLEKMKDGGTQARRQGRRTGLVRGCHRRAHGTLNRQGQGQCHPLRRGWRHRERRDAGCRLARDDYRFPREAERGGVQGCQGRTRRDSNVQHHLRSHR